MLPSALAARRTLDRDLALTLSAAEWEWAGMTPNIEQSWAGVGPRLTSVVEKGQLRAATHGVQAVEPILAEQGAATASRLLFQPRSLVGIASDGRSLVSLLTIGAVRAVQTVQAGGSHQEGLAAGWQFLEKAISTQIADAARVALQTQSIASTKSTLMVRVVNPGACSRCIALAGRETWSTTAFLRHPQCRCLNVPVDGDLPENVGTDPQEYFDSLSEEEQDATFTKAGAQAIRDGADMHQVVNARRGMSTTVGTAQKRLARDATGLWSTTEGTTRRGYAHKVMARQPGWSEQVGDSVTRRKVTEARLMPESIYELADDRAEALEMLKAYGYFGASPQ